MHPNLAIIDQNRCGALPKNGISLEEIIIFLEKISAKTPNPKLLWSIPEDDDKEAIDKYLNVELIMDVGTNNEWWGCVVKWSWGLEGEPIGCAHSNPLFDTRENEVEVTDGTHKKQVTNQYYCQEHVCTSQWWRSTVCPHWQDCGSSEEQHSCAFIQRNDTQCQRNGEAQGDRNYTAMRTHMQWSVHLSALLIT